MPDLSFQIERAEPQLHAAAPILLFALRISQAEGSVTPIHTIALRCQIRVEPARRTYTTAERERLRDLFGTPERWGQTLRQMLWTHVSLTVPPVGATALVNLPVPCTLDFSLAATKYFDALADGEIPLLFLFSGTVFFEANDGALQVSQISWEKEAGFRLPAVTWRKLMEHYYPNTALLSLRKDIFDRLDCYRRNQGLLTWEHALDRLLASANEPVIP